MKRYGTIGLAVLFIAAAAWAGEKSASIPFQWSSHHLSVQVKIDDHPQEYCFIIDTGGMTFIDKALADSLGLKQRGPMAKVKRLVLPGFEFEDVFCFTTFNFKLMEKTGHKVYGVIGSNLMERFRTVIHFQEEWISFTEDSSAFEPSDGDLLLPFRFHPVNRAPVIPFQVNGDSLLCMIDTGQPYPLVLPMDRLPGAESEGLTHRCESNGVMVKWPMTSPKKNVLASLASCRIGDAELTNLLCLYAQLPPMLSMPLIGNDWLKSYVLTIDYPRQQVLLSPVNRVEPPQDIYTWGFNIEMADDQTWRVAGVWQDSPADKAGLKPGDKVLGINGQKPSLEKLGELNDNTRKDSVSEVVLELAGREMTLKKAWLLSSEKE